MYLIDSTLVDVDEGGGPLQVLQVDVVDDPRVNDDVILKENQNCFKLSRD